MDGEVDVVLLDSQTAKVSFACPSSLVFSAVPLLSPLPLPLISSNKYPPLSFTPRRMPPVSIASSTVLAVLWTSLAPNPDSRLPLACPRPPGL